MNKVKVEELTVEDVKKTMRNLKNNKAAGTDGIRPDLIKYGGNKLLNRMYELVRQIHIVHSPTNGLFIKLGKV
jgi:hypothetical protein